MVPAQKYSMREQMAATITDLFAQDERVALVLAVISRPLFNEVFERYATRAIDVGIMEQTMISVAAGFALEGFIPFTHSITPFLVERPLEQIKDDFCYQQLGGNFISTGASYDYGTDGMTHYGAADVPLLSQLPGMQITVPGTASELDRLLRSAYANGSPTYYRTSLAENTDNFPVEFGKLTVVKQGREATVIAVGPTLNATLPAVADLDVTLLYCTTVKPFDTQTLQATTPNGGAIIVIEPYYEGGLVPTITAAMEHVPTRIKAIGVPRQVISRYGTFQQHDEAFGLTPSGIRQRIDQFLQRQ
jgi:transketolase